MLSIHAIRVASEYPAAVGAAVSDHRYTTDVEVFYPLLKISVLVYCDWRSADTMMGKCPASA